MAIEFVSNGPELFRVYFTLIPGRDIDGVPDITEREFPEEKWIVELIIGCPHNEFLGYVHQEQEKPENERNWDLVTHWNEIRLLETYPVESEKLHWRHQEILKKALSSPPATTQEVNTPIWHETYSPQPGLFDSEEVETALQAVKKNLETHEMVRGENEYCCYVHHWPSLCTMEMIVMGHTAHAKVTFDKYPDNPIYMRPSIYYECRGYRQKPLGSQPKGLSKSFTAKQFQHSPHLLCFPGKAASGNLSWQ